MPIVCSKNACVLTVALLLACDSKTDTKSDAKSTSDAKGDVKGDAKADAKADAKTDAETEVAAAPAYAAPASPCGVADLAPLGADAGKPGEGSVESEGTDLVIPVCSYDLTADAINTFKLLVAVDDKAQARYQQTEEVFASMGLGFVTEPVTGLGTKALYAVRLTAENQRIESTLALVDRNLYLELRFMGGGSKPWDSADMRDRLSKIAAAAMTKLTKPR